VIYHLLPWQRLHSAKIKMGCLKEALSSYCQGMRDLASVLDPSLAASLQQLPATASSQIYEALMQDLTRFCKVIDNPRLNARQLQLVAAPIVCVADGVASRLDLLNKPADEAKRQQAQSELLPLSAWQRMCCCTCSRRSVECLAVIFELSQCQQPLSTISTLLACRTSVAENVSTGHLHDASCVLVSKRCIPQTCMSGSFCAQLKPSD
jgi:hypothetical protein